MSTCVGPFTFESNEVETEILDITITKQTDCAYAVTGKTICYSFQIINNSPIDTEQIIFEDELDARLSYIEESFEVDGLPEKPELSGQIIQYALDIPSGETVEIKFCVTVNSAPS